MKLPHLRHHKDETETSETHAELANYDAQSDLAIHHTGHEEEIDTGAGAFGGSLVPDMQHPGYDVSRDVGIEP